MSHRFIASIDRYVTGNIVVKEVEPEDRRDNFGKWRTATGAFMMQVVRSDQLRASDRNALIQCPWFA